MGGRPKTYTRADRRLKENRHLPPYEDRNSHIRPQPKPTETLSSGKQINILNRIENQNAADKKE